jgi:hypothetical protein
MPSLARASLVLFTLMSVALCAPARAQDEPPSPPPNTLTAEERAEGWTLLFDGSTPEGWRGYGQAAFPDRGWTVEDGVLTVDGAGGDIVTTETYSDFVLRLEWKIAKGGNSGIVYCAVEHPDRAIYWSAPEMQILDNAHHPDAPRGENGNRKAGSLYDLIPADPQPFTGHGKWQEVMIVVEGGHVEHWLNGRKVLAYELWTPEWYRMLRDSKFRSHPEFGDAREGHIGLQEHGTTAHFRNIKIKTL